MANLKLQLGVSYYSQVKKDTKERGPKGTSAGVGGEGSVLGFVILEGSWIP